MHGARDGNELNDFEKLHIKRISLDFNLGRTVRCRVLVQCVTRREGK
jgi:hypothetical protein